MKKMINLYLVFTLSCFLHGCAEPKNKDIKSLTLNLQEGEPPSLNPYVGVDLRSRCLYLALFEPLMRRRAHGCLELAAAQRVDIDPLQTSYTFTIRNHCWSNGERVTAYHFEQAWKYALTPGSHCFRADVFYPIKNAEKVRKGELPLDTVGIRAIDAETLCVLLEHPTPYFLELTATSFYAPLYHPSDKEPTFFNGPFTVKEHIFNQKLTLQINPFYWDKRSIELDEICFTMVKDPMTAYAMYEKGELDLVGDPFSSLPFDMIPSLEKAHQLHRKPISRIFYLMINTEIFPFNNAKFRRALSLSIDRRELTEHLFFGEIPTYSLLPTTLSFLKIKDSHESQEECKILFEQALKELGIERESLPKLVLSYAELSGQKKFAECIQAQWKNRLGIEIDLVCNEWNIHSSNLKQGNYQIGTLHLTTLYQDPMFYLDLFRDKIAFTNYCRWENDHYKKLLEESEKTDDIQTRQYYLQQAEKQLLEEMPAMGIYTQNLQYLVGEHIHLEISDLGIYDFKHTFIK